jgi:spore maturation protein CgeB
MKLVIFGLTVTSSWGNGHATIWRGLLSGLAALGHRATFFERDVPYYASHRDLRESAESDIHFPVPQPNCGKSGKPLARAL